VKRKPSQTTLAAVVGGLLLLAVVASYFLLISPQRSKAADLAKEAETTRQELARLRALSVESRNVQPIRVAELFRLTKAIPNETDMPGIILELNRIARETGIRFDAITPQAGSESTNGYQIVPVNLVFQGNYFELSDFLFRLRSLVSVRGGRLNATGRLFVVDSVAFSEGVKKFPQIQATLTVAAFVHGTSTAAAAPATAPPAAPAPASPDTPPATSPGPTAVGATP
jgi:Pilus assembly protein, PilO